MNAPAHSFAAPRAETLLNLRYLRQRRRRAYTVTLLALSSLVIVLFLAAMALGDFRVPVIDILRILAGDGEGGAKTVVLNLRLPRALGALLTGAGFALSGALFQSLLRNPLASPDVIGVNAGASAAAVFAIIGLGISGLSVSAVAFAGALASAVTVHLLAGNRGMANYRFVLMGIGVGVFMSGVVSWVITNATIVSAQQALIWLTGTLNGLSWNRLQPLAIGYVMLLPLAWIARSALDVLETGEETAAGLGLPVAGMRLLIIATGVGLAAFATATVGPVAFVALISTPITRFLLPGAPALVPTALVGAAIMLGADLIAQHTPFLPQLPVGAVTGILGAPYFVWRIVVTNRKA